MRCLSAALAALVVAASTQSHGAQTTWRSEALAVTQHFSAPASDADDKPRGISGIACAKPAASGARECALANDEESFLGIVSVDGDMIRPTGRTVALSGPADAIVGTRRIANCPVKTEEGGIGKPDTEGLALQDGFLYVAGSHSCSGGGKYRPASFLLSRYSIAGAGDLSAGNARLEQSWRLADALVASDAGAAYGKRKDDGTNIEGIAVGSGTVYAGLRTPLLDHHAVIVTAPVEKLFAAGTAPLDPDDVKTFRMPLGIGSGIRDLAALDGDGLLILSGPTHIQTDVPYRLWLADRTRLNDPPLFLALVAPTPGPAGAMPKGRGYGGSVPKPEAVAVLEETPDRLTVLVMYDNVDEGWPTRLTIELQP